MGKISKESYLKLLKSCTENCTSEYCFFRILLEHLHPSERLLTQLKCIEILKWEISSKEKKDIGWRNASLIWVENGYADAFAKIYNESESIREIYKKTKELAENKNTKSMLDISNVSSKISKIITTELN